MTTTLENDMSCLLESIQCLGNDKSQIIQALEHLAEMTLQDNGADIFNRIGGISSVLKLAFNKKGTHSNAVQKALILLGNSVLHCYGNKNILCTDHIMENISTKILHDVHNTKMIASGAYFLSCLCANSERVQNKTRKSKILEKLVTLYRNYHPRGSLSTNPSKEQWFEKAASNSPVVLTHVSHALKSLMNKPKNIENQIVCSRLLNLALCTLGSTSESVSSKVEALQFISDCLYENDKTQNIFNMIGGMRLLPQLLKRHVDDGKDVVSKKNLELADSILDALNVAITEHNKSKETSAESGLIDCLVRYLQSEEYESLHMKSMICLSELVHENESCQKKLISCNGVPEIINIMSKKQDDMLSKIGTSILQSCVQYQDDLDGTVEVKKVEQEKIQSTTSSSNVLKDLVNSFGDENVPDVLAALIKKVGLDKSAKQKNIRRGKRSLTQTKVASIHPKENQNQEEMIGMLKNQHELLQTFQEEIKSLRAEVRSQAASDCGDITHHQNGNLTPMTPSRKTAKSYMGTPTRKLYANICPGTAPNKRKFTQVDPSSSCWTPQANRRMVTYSKRNMSSIDGNSPQFADILGVEMAAPNHQHHNIQDDDERPALHRESDADVGYLEVRDASTPSAFRQQSVFEKVQKWQAQSATSSMIPPNKNDKDGFKIPLLTPLSRQRKSVVRKQPLNNEQRVFYKTPAINTKTKSHVLNAPKKKELTKRRCPTSSDEGFCDDALVSRGEAFPGLRRTLSFDKVREESEPYFQATTVGEQKASYHVNSNEEGSMDLDAETCEGCRPTLLTMNSKNVVKYLEDHRNTCEFHDRFLQKVRHSYNSIKQQLPSTRRTLVANFEKKTPKKSLVHGNKNDWESMSVFSYRSNRSNRSCAPSECSAYTSMTSSNRRRRKDYSHEEVNYILDGVERYGRRWTMILNAYPFKGGRTSVDLSDKYKKLKVHGPKYTNLPVPFTTQELVNLKHGVAKLGEEWPNILKNYEFATTRTPYDLKEKWEKLMKNHMSEF